MKLDKEKDSGGPAFPIAFQHRHKESENSVTIIRSQEWQGMTLLDYFAGQALIGVIVANANRTTLRIDEVCEAVNYAEDMLKVLKVRKQGADND